jgi:Tol biopolymer transport system component
VLTYLVERHGRLVAKPELIEAVWPGANVTDNSLAQCLKEIRRALGDDSQELVRTVARRGYLVNAVAAPAVGVPQSAPSVRRNFVRGFAPAAGLLLALAAAGLISRPVTSPQEVRNAYTQLTNFPDSAVGPALSPDGKTLAFLRSESAFLSPGQIYVKQLPNGEPVQVTHDPRTKYGPAFSPDGSLLGFSLMGGPAPSDWATYVVSPQGGSPRLLLRNASGLTWIDRRRLLFSEIGSGMHMGIVTAAENRSEARNVYWPRDERAMAHFSYASPNRKWALVVEMNPAWEPCRLVPLDGTSAGSKVGPQGACTSAAWSPDGQWMYFGSTVDGSGHLWRQRFPDGKPELITAGPTEEEGIAVAPDGRSLITSVGMRQSAVWLHDSRGERPISTEGFALDVRQGEGFGAAPVFAADGKSVYYLLRRQSRESPKTLWRADLASEKSAEVLSGASIHEYDISNDGKQVVYSTREPGENSRIWLAPLDRASAAKPVAFVIGTGASPRFGPDGEILFRDSDGKSNYLARMNPDGSGRARVSPYPIGTIQTISGDRRWIAAIAPVHGDSAAVATVAVPLNGDPARRICATVCSVAWARDGRFIYISLKEPSPNQRGTTVALQLRPGDVLPPLPSSGIRWLEDGSGLPGATLIDNARIVPGPDPSTYAIVRAAVQRNLFRIPLPRR